jgi:hypothetical protein
MVYSPDFVMVLGLEVAEDVPDDGTEDAEHDASHHDCCEDHGCSPITGKTDGTGMMREDKGHPGCRQSPTPVRCLSNCRLNF